MHLSGLVSMNVRADLSCLVSTDWVALWLVAATAFCLLFLLLFLLVCDRAESVLISLSHYHKALHLISSNCTSLCFTLPYSTLLWSTKAYLRSAVNCLVSAAYY